MVRRKRPRFVFGLPGNTILADAVEAAADDIRTRRALDQKPALRGFAETRYRAKSWKRERRACARIEATTKGLDIRGGGDRAAGVSWRARRAPGGPVRRLIHCSAER